MDLPPEEKRASTSHLTVQDALIFGWLWHPPLHPTGKSRKNYKIVLSLLLSCHAVTNRATYSLLLSSHCSTVERFLSWGCPGSISGSLPTTTKYRGEVNSGKFFTGTMYIYTFHLHTWASPCRHTHALAHICKNLQQWRRQIILKKKKKKTGLHLGSRGATCTLARSGPPWEHLRRWSCMAHLAQMAHYGTVCLRSAPLGGVSLNMGRGRNGRWQSGNKEIHIKNTKKECLVHGRRIIRETRERYDRRIKTKAKIRKNRKSRK